MQDSKTKLQSGYFRFSDLKDTTFHNKSMKQIAFERFENTFVDFWQTCWKRDNFEKVCAKKDDHTGSPAILKKLEK